ncbi:hypothetical protein K3165_02620 [Qipengyuania sp. 1XM1-15A]|uniref:hypothetical protein n=1 Tax=Qipengyuania xiamenensis TaxID=2867237 RepID=UPI001C871E45|nr:hypothetical protein [Qipengyuania xiamenensis]MBX7531815.1 hypothetical protein [Qipengyuania xiamenensis]
MANENGEPKPGGKTAAQFPTHDLAQCIAWAERLVSKTHSAAQPLDIIYAAVVDAKGWRGRAKLSAMEQFGLAIYDGDTVEATDLAKEISRAPEDERGSSLKSAALTPKLFNAVYSTFSGDKVSLAKIRQRLLELGAHPDKVEKCVEIYSATLTFADLASLEGDQLTHGQAAKTAQTSGSLSSSEQAHDIPTSTEDQELEETRNMEPQNFLGRGRSAVEINISIDSTLDVEKLEQHLKLLKRYGAI